MWASDDELADLIAEKMVKKLGRAERKYVAPAPEPPPFKPEPVPRYESQLEAMQRRARDEVRSGRAISANMLRPKPKPPTRPDQQRRRSNGFWDWWR